jgi:hypothetical protein
VVYDRQAWEHETIGVLLQDMAEEVEKKEFLSEDSSNGEGIFRNDMIELVDLDRHEFNGNKLL